MRILAASILFCAAAAHAESLQDGGEPTAVLSFESGQMMPFTVAPDVHAQTALVRAFGGYDFGAHETSFEATAQLHLWGPFALRGGGDYEDTTGRLRPSVGVIAQVMTQAKSGLDAAVGIFYRASGFTALDDGEVEVLLTASRRIGRTSLYASAALHTDLDDDADTEFTVGFSHRLAHNLFTGVDTRLLVNLTSEHPDVPSYEVMGGPTLTLALDRYAITAQFGLSASSQNTRNLGLFSMAGVTALF